jgi:hypothetical protein
MTKEDLARKLDGCEYGNEMSAELVNAAKRSRLVVVYGASDDLTEFSGFFRDEGGLGEFFIVNGSLLEPHECNCEFCGFKDKTHNAIKVTSGFDDNGFHVTCNAPHATFSVMEEGERYGNGLVIQI